MKITTMHLLEDQGEKDFEKDRRENSVKGCRIIKEGKK